MNSLITVNQLAVQRLFNARPGGHRERSIGDTHFVEVLDRLWLRHYGLIVFVEDGAGVAQRVLVVPRGLSNLTEIGVFSDAVFKELVACFGPHPLALQERTCHSHINCSLLR